MKEPKSCGTYNSNFPIAPGSKLASETIPLSKVLYEP
jgi:hypothetical protein